MDHAKIIFNGVMVLALRAGIAALLILYGAAPFPESFTDPVTVFSGLPVEVLRAAGTNLLFLSLFLALSLSGTYVFIRALMGTDLLSDPARWREQAIPRRSIRLAAFLLLSSLWVFHYHSAEAAMLASGRMEETGALVRFWAALSLYFCIAVLVALRPPRSIFWRIWLGVPVGLSRRPAGGARGVALAIEAGWTDFLADFLPFGAAFDSEGGGNGGGNGGA